MKTDLTYLKSCDGGCHATVRVTITTGGRTTTHDVFVDVAGERQRGFSDYDREQLASLLVRGMVLDTLAEKQGAVNTDLRTKIEAAAMEKATLEAGVKK